MHSDKSKRIRKRLCICGCILWTAALPGLAPRAFSQQNPEIRSASVYSSPAVIRISSNLVTVPVSVTDASGRLIRGLKINDFRIAENGNPESVSKMVETNPPSLRLALLFDVSGSVHSLFQFEQQAAMRFLEETWRPGDSASVIAFNEEAHIQLRDSDSLAGALRALTELQPTKSATALFDSLVLSARILEERRLEGRREAIIVISDGADNRSDHRLRETLQKIRNSGAIFYAINPSGASVRLNEINRRAQEDLAALANATGGTVFVTANQDDLNDAYRRIATELRAQYVLGYYSSNCDRDGGFRRITVSIPGKPDLSVHARHGYYALRQ